uniref:16S rRNA (Cytosine(1402)-N(4))-methyltransferase n=1 Tax=Eucampia antarctica TaxID=49252 RepID=A0A7S2SBE8_9STRA
MYDAVAAVIPQFNKKSRRNGRTATLARVFQSLRIVVNEEDRALEEALMDMAPNLIRKGGRLVALSYHSMEDRAVKRVMRDGTLHKIGSRGAKRVERDVYGNIIDDGTRCWKPLGKRAKATPEEIEINTRARSATLRVAERL